MPEKYTATDIEIATLAGRIKALEVVLTQVLGRYAREFGPEGQNFIMSITSSMTADVVDDHGDESAKASLEGYADMAEQIEQNALEALFFHKP